MTQMLTDRHHERLAGMLSCYDRMVFTGTLPGACYAAGMASVLNARPIRILTTCALPNRCATACVKPHRPWRPRRECESNTSPSLSTLIKTDPFSLTKMDPPPKPVLARAKSVFRLGAGSRTGCAFCSPAQRILDAAEGRVRSGMALRGSMPFRVETDERRVV